MFKRYFALPKVYTTYDPQEVLKEFTEEFHKQYGIECVSALRHNKRKTNYHIHLIFSERTLLPEPDIKIASQYNRDLAQWERTVQEKKQPTEKLEKQSVRDQLRRLQEEGRKTPRNRNRDYER